MVVFSPVRHVTDMPFKSGKANRETWSAFRQISSSRSACSGSVTCSTVAVKSERVSASAVRPNFSMSLENSSRKNSG